MEGFGEDAEHMMICVSSSSHRQELFPLWYLQRQTSEEDTMATNPLQDSDTAHCIRNCLTTHKACLETLHYMLTQKSTHFQGKHVTLLQLCADTSDLSAKMMIADVEFHQQSCALCFELCQACAEECERYPEDAELRRCADLCRQCAESCQAMMGMTVTMASSARARKPQETSRQI